MRLKTDLTNKRKIINDPVHGFIQIPSALIHDLIQHPYFQRLRNIKQLGLSHLVYPGANHTRFQHALGAMHLAGKAIDVLRKKGVEITSKEQEATMIAVLLHDMGHGPLSHTLEHTLLKRVKHEVLSLLFMQKLNDELGGKLQLAMAIFTNRYHKSFLHNLVSGQLDMDRLDYLQRDSFFTGVSEGVVGGERIITMLNVFDGQLVVEEKGIYSVENFISSRRVMYWQVYLHKAVVASEYMLINLLNRVKYLIGEGTELFASPFLRPFLKGDITLEQLRSDDALFHQFASADDSDLMVAIKVWQSADDTILSLLCRSIVSRRLFKTEIAKSPFPSSYIQDLSEHIERTLQLRPEEVGYFLQAKMLVNEAYHQTPQPIYILSKDNSMRDLANASDKWNIAALSSPVEKYCLCYFDTTKWAS